ncbi:AGC/YANK protein kinase [Allomyces macrogynus ATCC 38327]|uniref:AGC/YANK protein kinase n=1 Tax=Allomyces macrogynus (strain ATCC 38327) TaxID=578462 RepID=A0A0L0T2E4_ALLM3|nr:AGC/YANK protein kinase [Allomyces macrogynus ATCC 38327]|eukprot:KNE68754.1 AGC/YANK protein kinase [Allomyces macrogynus ATCC 38327]
MGGQWSSEFDANAPVDLRHFKLGRSIGRGAFGKVKVVVKRDTKRLYALKYINKEQCIKKRAYRNIFRERTLLENLEHPFIVNLRYAFQDDENMFMVLDLMLGGDLRFHLNRMGKFTERMAVFYAAELSSALMYLHTRRVVHRDIKPDNILLDAEGHVHLTDFNCATVLEDRKKVTSETGTQGYMAPEVYGDQGYNEAVDWWSLGVVLWECLHGERPFSASRIDKLVYRVKNAPITFSEEMSRRMRSLLEGFLERDATKRLGISGNGHEDLLAHPAFKRIDWQLLLQKEIEPPFIPDDRKLNFDARYELEEILLEENPLHAKPRKKDPGTQSREMRLIEEEFKPFDYTAQHRHTGQYHPGVPAASAPAQGAVESAVSAAGGPVYSQPGGTEHPPAPRPSLGGAPSVRQYHGDPSNAQGAPAPPDASQLPTEFAGSTRRGTKDSKERERRWFNMRFFGGSPSDSKTRKSLSDSDLAARSLAAASSPPGPQSHRHHHHHYSPQRTPADSPQAAAAADPPTNAAAAAAAGATPGPDASSIRSNQSPFPRTAGGGGSLGHLPMTAHVQMPPRGASVQNPYRQRGATFGPGGSSRNLDRSSPPPPRQIGMSAGPRTAISPPNSAATALAMAAASPTPPNGAAAPITAANDDRGAVPLGPPSAPLMPPPLMPIPQVPSTQPSPPASLHQQQQLMDVSQSSHSSAAPAPAPSPPPTRSTSSPAMRQSPHAPAASGNLPPQTPPPARQPLPAVPIPQQQQQQQQQQGQRAPTVPVLPSVAAFPADMFDQALRELDSLSSSFREANALGAAAAAATDPGAGLPLRRM